MDLFKEDLTIMREDVNNNPTILIENLVSEGTVPTSSAFVNTRNTSPLIIRHFHVVVCQVLAPVGRRLAGALFNYPFTIHQWYIL